jgi:hypothetical protein
MRRFFALTLSILIAACSSAPPTLKPLPTLDSAPTVSPTIAAAPATATLTPTIAPLPTATPAPDSVLCPLSGLPVSKSVLATRRSLMVQIGNSGPERPQFGLAQADLIFETLSEGGITRFSAVYLCQDAQDIAGVRSARLINLQIIPIFDAILAHVGASAAVLDLIERDIRIRDSRLDYFRNNPGFTLQPERRRPPFDVFTNTQALWDAARSRNVPMPGNPVPEIKTSSNVPPNGLNVRAVTIHHHSSYWVRWKWDDEASVWTRHISSDVNAAGDVPHLDAATARVLTTKNIVIIRAQHKQTDIIEDTLGSRSQTMEITGAAGDAIFLRDGQMFKGKWKRDKVNEWFTFTLADGKPFELRPGNTYVHFYDLESPFYPIDVVTR